MDLIKKSLVSTVANMVMGDVEKIDKALKDLTDKKIQALHYFIKYELGIQKYKINIDLEKETIIIRACLSAVPKHILPGLSNQQLWTGLAEFLGIPNFKLSAKITYAKRPNSNK